MQIYLEISTNFSAFFYKSGKKRQKSDESGEKSGESGENYLIFQYESPNFVSL